MKNINSIINVINQCTGCGICSIVCPKKCISVLRNKTGFYQAIVDESKCINCGICQSFCYKYYRHNPIDSIQKVVPLLVAAVWSKDHNLVNLCSSGGFATELSLFYLKKGYKICGVVYDNQTNTCKHTIGKNQSEIINFIGSKYLQSYTIDAFSQFNGNDRYLVFGSPCQIFGLRQFINKNKIDKNFILVDFYCHGIPSYNLWTKYIEYLQINGISKIDSINFVSKKRGWHNRSILINSCSKSEYEKSYKDDIFGIFYSGMYCHNTSCFKCQFRSDYIFSDIRIADFWGSRFKSNQKGVNLLTIYTPSGKNAFDLIHHKLVVKSASISDLKNSKPWRFYRRPIRYKKIMHDLQSNKKLKEIYSTHIKPFLFIERNLHRLQRRMKRFYKY